MESRTAYSTWTPQKPTLFGGHYLRKRSTLDIGVLGYIGIVQHKEHSPEVLSIPSGISCINSTNIPPIMIINGIYETQNLLSLQLVSFLVGLRTYQHRCMKQ